MPRNINSAYRVYSFLSAACEQKGSEYIWKAFANVLGISSPNTRKLIFEVQRSLDLFFDELERARQQLDASGYSPDLYEGVFTTIQQHIDSSLIYNQWEGNKNVIITTLPILKFCSEALPHEEELIDEQALNSIREILQKLEAQLEKGDLPEQAKAFIRHHITIIKKALSDYYIIGIKSFSAAMYEGYVDYLRHEEVVQENENKEEFGLLRKVWTGIKRVADLTPKAEKLLTSGSKLYEMGEKVADHIDKLTWNKNPGIGRRAAQA